jgi:tetratricopeptide (TPR) repeat protein
MGHDLEDEHPMRALGRHLDIARLRRGWTYEEWAAKTGFSKSRLHYLVHTARRAWDHDLIQGLVEGLGESWDADWECRWRRTAEVGSEPAAPPPFQLPADTTYFTGREPELRELLTAAECATVFVVAGMGGVGKTGLVVHAAHRLARKYRDGVLFLNLHGFTPDAEPTPPAAALDTLLRGLGVPGQRIPPSLDGRVGLYRTLVAHRHLLIVLDNAADERQVRPLLPGAGRSRVLITSRRRLAGLDEARHVALTTLSQAEAIDLFGLVGGGCGDSESVRHIVRLVGLLPLGVRIVAARCRTGGAVPATLVTELATAGGRLAALDDGERSVTAALAVSYRHLTAAQRSAFHLLGGYPGGDIDRFAMAALAGLELPRAQRLLDGLRAVNLLDEPEPHRYALHDLTRDYAATMAADHEAAECQEAALARLLDYYCHAATSATEALYPYQVQQRLWPQNGIAVPDFDERTAAEWLDAELPNVLAAAAQANDHGELSRIVELSAILRSHLRTRAYYASAEALHNHGLNAALRTNDHRGAAVALVGLGDANRTQGRHERAERFYRQALEMVEEPGEHNALGRFYATRGLAHLHALHGKYERALELYRDAEDAGRPHGYFGDLDVLTGLGRTLLVLGDLAASACFFHNALSIARSTGNRLGELDALYGLGDLELLHGRHSDAADYFERTLRLTRAVRFRVGEANALIGLANSRRLQGQHRAALDLFSGALQLAEEIGFRVVEIDALDGLGLTYRACGRPDIALTHHRRALDLTIRSNQRHDQARAHEAIAAASQDLDNQRDAREHLQRALEIYTELGTPDAQRISANLKI